MTYHTNHCSCRTSNWNDEMFHGEVMVIFGENIDTDSICKYDHKIPDPDFEKLTLKNKFFDEEELKQRIKIEKEFSIEKNTVFDEEKYIERAKNWMTKDTVTLKPEVIEWLNDNIKDRIVYDKNKDNPLADIKGWCIGNDSYNSNQSYEIKVFFARQVDALKFIRKFSIFKLLTFYFDYFHSERKEMKSSEIIKIINENTKLNLKLKDYDFKNDIEEETSTNLDYFTFTFIDWERVDEEGYDDDNDLTEEEIKIIIDKIISVDKL